MTFVLANTTMERFVRQLNKYLKCSCISAASIHNMTEIILKIKAPHGFSRKYIGKFSVKLRQFMNSRYFFDSLNFFSDILVL